MLVKIDRNNYWMLNWLDEFMMGHKGFICGGCFKNIFSKQKVKDLDIFFRNKLDFEDAKDYFDSMTPNYNNEDNKRNEEYTFYYENDNVKAYKHIRTGIVIELCCKIFGTAEQILNKFDFTITKFAYYKEQVQDEDDPQQTHIEYMVLMDDKFFEHLHIKRLVIDKDIYYPMSTFERMFKYAKYGYYPCKESKIKIIKAVRKLTDDQVELSKNLYDGID